MGNVRQDHELTEKIFALETELGIGKNDRREYQRLTDLQWYYVMTRCSRGAAMNKAEWSRDTSTDQSYIYKLQANDKVAEAMMCMSKSKNRIKLDELSDVAWDFASKGDHRWAKLWMDINIVKDTDGQGSQEAAIDWSLINPDKDSDTKDLPKDSPPPSN